MAKFKTGEEAKRKVKKPEYYQETINSINRILESMRDYDLRNERLRAVERECVYTIDSISSPYPISAEWTISDSSN
jgi:hypothetical protein